MLCQPHVTPGQEIGTATPGRLPAKENLQSPTKRRAMTVAATNPRLLTATQLQAGTRFSAVRSRVLSDHGARCRELEGKARRKGGGASVQVAKRHCADPRGGACAAAAVEKAEMGANGYDADGATDGSHTRVNTRRVLLDFVLYTVLLQPERTIAELDAGDGKALGYVSAFLEDADASVAQAAQLVLHAIAQLRANPWSDLLAR